MRPTGYRRPLPAKLVRYAFALKAYSHRAGKQARARITSFIDGALGFPSASRQAPTNSLKWSVTAFSADSRTITSSVFIEVPLLPYVEHHVPESD